MMRTRDIRHRRHEVSGWATVVDEAVRLRTGVGKRRGRIHFALCENSDRPHQNVVLVAKRLKLRAARSCSLRHNALPREAANLDTPNLPASRRQIGSIVSCLRRRPYITMCNLRVKNYLRTAPRWRLSRDCWVPCGSNAACHVFWGPLIDGFEISANQSPFCASECAF
jgi:hypothetical protein